MQAVGNGARWINLGILLRCNRLRSILLDFSLTKPWRLVVWLHGHGSELFTYFRGPIINFINLIWRAGNVLVYSSNSVGQFFVIYLTILYASVCGFKERLEVTAQFLTLPLAYQVLSAPFVWMPPRAYAFYHKPSKSSFQCR